MQRPEEARFRFSQNCERPTSIRVSELFMNCIFIIAMKNNFLKREFVAIELKGVFNLVEEMLSIAKESYCASLTASQMGHLAFEHTVTITGLRSRIAELQTEIRCWVERSSQDATAAMILAEENVVLARTNGELSEHMTKLNERQMKKTETLERLLANSDFGLPTTLLNEILPSGQTLLDLLDLPGIYSRLIGGLRGPVPNDKGELSILAPTTLATRNDLIDSIERQLRRPLGPEVNLANAYLNVAQTRDQEARRRGTIVYPEGRILKRHQNKVKVLHVLKASYYWPNMAKQRR
jgi:hypothetical protein